MTKAQAQFVWTDEHVRAFEELKKALSSAPVLAHYSPTAKTRVVVDASSWALGAVLLQEQDDSSYRPIAFGSTSLSETEQKYGQIEKESLAIVFGCEHFHMYLYGRKFEIETDHRPLEHIYRPKGSSTGKLTPARIERWRDSKSTTLQWSTIQAPKTLPTPNHASLSNQRPKLEATWKHV